MNVVKEPKSWAMLQEKLLHEATASLTSAEAAAVNIATYKHGVISQVLRTLYYDTNFKGKHLRLIFEDGSQPTPFPCGLFTDSNTPHKPDYEKNYPNKFQLGLMSLRHPELDYLVDFHIIRNRDVYDLESSAMVEEFAFSETLKLLSDPWLQDGGLLRLYHTGLEPVVIGFYRGLVAAFAQRKKTDNSKPLVVQPYIFVDKGQKKHLNPKSPGANPEKYFQPKNWM